MKTVSALLSVLGVVSLAAQPVSLPKISLTPFSPPPAAITGPSEPEKPMEAKAPTLDKAANMKSLLNQIGVLLTEEQRKHLEQHRFVLMSVTGTRLETVFEPPSKEKDEDGNVVPDYRSTPDEMLAAFDHIAEDPSDPWSRTPGQAKYITADLAMHAFHRFFSQALEFLEQRQLRARLEDVLEQAMTSARALKKDAPKEAQARLEVVEAQFAAAWCVLGRETPGEKMEEETDPEIKAAMERANPRTDPRTVTERLSAKTKNFSAEVAARLKAEVAQIMSTEQTGTAGLFGEYDPTKTPDYTQFRPRSHYTKSEELKGYFRAMMFLGRNGYALNPESGPPTLGLTDSLLAAMALSRPDEEGKRALDGWKQLMEITGFFAGQSDDLTFIELREWLAAKLGRESLTPADAVNAELLAQLKGALAGLRLPQIVADERSRERREGDLRPEFRIFGQRFSFDAWVLNKFITDKLTMPTGLFIPAAFGDVASEVYAKDFIKERFEPADEPMAVFEKTLAELRGKLAQVPDELWFGSMAGQQLHAIATLAGRRNENYPAFMRGPEYAKKDIESMLGHWTEIKHDTVLYAKQSYAEMGEGGDSDKPMPPMPRGLVQPDVRFWREMERLADFTRQGMLKHALLPGMEEDEWAPLNRFHTDMKFCREIAEKEVRGMPLTKDELEKIWQFTLTYMEQPLDQNGIPDAERGKSALITDVHTDAYSNQVLQDALGRPCVLIALVGNENTPRLVTGMAYQHFEFTGPQDQRATDEEWRAKVYAAKPELPPRAKWALPVFPAKADPKGKKKREID
jgi:hypothetical protein